MSKSTLSSMLVIRDLVILLMTKKKYCMSSYNSEMYLVNTFELCKNDSAFFNIQCAFKVVITCLE